MFKLFRKWLYPKDENRTLDVIGDAVMHIEKETRAAVIIIIAVDGVTSNIDICTNEGVNMVAALDYLHEEIVGCISDKPKRTYTKYECKQSIDFWLEQLSIIEQQEQTT